MILAPEEIRLVTGRTRRDKQRETLKALGIKFGVRPDGSLVVLEVEARRALCSHDECITPDTSTQPRW